MNINSSYFQSNDLLASNPFQVGISSQTNSGTKNVGVIYNNQTKSERQENSHYVVIDSSRRIMENESMWNFKIKFNTAYSEVRKQAIYENGSFVRYDSVFFSGERGCHVKNSYKNVIGFDVVRVEIPMRILDFIGASLHTIFIQIPELSGFDSIKTNHDGTYSFILQGHVHSQLSLVYKSLTPMTFHVPTNQLKTINLKTHIPPYSSAINNIKNIGDIDNFLLSKIKFIQDDNTSDNQLELICDNKIPYLFSTNDILSFDNISFASSNLRAFFEGRLHRITSVESNGVKIKASGLVVGPDDFDSNGETTPATTRVIHGSNVTALKPYVINMNLQIQYTLLFKTTQSVD
tara:strand:+ start:2065 stop:3108 length:1044 start_codon:yes stop_codon:yes gene_type:complete